MNRKVLMELSAVLVPVLAATIALQAQQPKSEDPPPGSAMTLSIPQARSMLRDAITRRYTGEIKSCGGVLFIKGCSTLMLSEATDIHVRTTGVQFVAPYTADGTHRQGEFALRFSRHPLSSAIYKYPPPPNYNRLNNQQFCSSPKAATISYLCAFRSDNSNSQFQVKPSPIYSVGFLPHPEVAVFDPLIFFWGDEATAQSFADTFNRLVYAAVTDEEWPSFSSAAKAWRENRTKPPLNPEADREWVLAENAIKEKNLPLAIEHYETALAIQPTWPAGWYDLALIYGELNRFAEAADAVRHYLELVPNAPDAQNVREQMYIWDEKAKH
jgi:hypothetical protein